MFLNQFLSGGGVDNAIETDELGVITKKTILNFTDKDLTLPTSSLTKQPIIYKTKVYADSERRNDTMTFALNKSHNDFLKSSETHFVEKWTPMEVARACFKHKLTINKTNRISTGKKSQRKSKKSPRSSSSSRSSSDNDDSDKGENDDDGLSDDEDQEPTYIPSDQEIDNAVMNGKLIIQSIELLGFENAHHSTLGVNIEGIKSSNFCANNTHFMVTMPPMNGQYRYCNRTIYKIDESTNDILKCRLPSASKDGTLTFNQNDETHRIIMHLIEHTTRLGGQTAAMADKMEKSKGKEEIELMDEEYLLVSSAFRQMEDYFGVGRGCSMNIHWTKAGMEMKDTSEMKGHVLSEQDKKASLRSAFDVKIRYSIV